MTPDTHMWLIPVEIAAGFIVQLLTFAFFYGKLVERVKTLGERQAEDRARVDRLEERLDHL